VLKDHKVKHRVISIEGLSELLNSSLISGGSEVPEGHYAQENMKATVVPNRNKIFSSIIQSVALSVAAEDKLTVIAMGLHAGDHAIYPDCRAEFRNADEMAFRVGNWDSEWVQYYTPYMHVNKFDILKDGLECCSKLGLDFDEVYRRTNTSYKPILTGGKWYSDYKSASSVERVEAFILLDRPDPVEYADESGPVSWEVVKEHVQEVLASHSN
jgi:7-cyano-7-deazaguanine synthase